MKKAQPKTAKNPAGDTFAEIDAKDARSMTEQSIRIEQVAFWQKQIYSLIRREAADGEFCADVPTHVPDKMKDRELTKAEIAYIAQDLIAKGFVVDHATSWMYIRW